ncbi:CAP domain-containing protein [Sphingomonas sp. HDW15A]|uniref:CAP domain-containing protein n=1 Tax=Sphingomonas sp. HDW15A TaxID=2714942 RepID=UPI001F0E60C2|nr:CAP domain-containing protein [Sphingomonas sp. HDW15A]
MALHNRERAAYGSPPLGWDPALAAQAKKYAHELAAIGRLLHSPKAQRPGQGENLWLGTRGMFGTEAMVGSWAGEKRHFRRGVFPANSTTGNWRDIGHYSQMVWPRTTRLGCGLASSARWDVLVCRYSPPGNQDGLRI